MLVVYFALMLLARHELAKLPYAKYRVPYLGLKFQASPNCSLRLAAG